jgi:hypothetical protein
MNAFPFEAKFIPKTFAPGQIGPQTIAYRDVGMTAIEAQSPRILIPIGKDGIAKLNIGSDMQTPLLRRESNLARGIDQPSPKEQEVIEKCKQNKKDVESSVSKGHTVSLVPLTKGSEGDPGSPKQPKKKKSKSNLYVSKADAAFPLQQNNLGFLPPSLQLFLFENENYSKECKSSKGDILVDDKLCVLRMGTVEEQKDSANVNKNQYFISCIANIYNSLTDQSLSSKDFKHMILIPRLTFDNFITYQNGTLVETFKKFEYVDREKLLTYKETDLFKKIFTDADADADAVDDDEDNKFVFFKSLIMSYENFIAYLKNDNIVIDYTYLWDYITDSMLWSEFKKNEEEGKRTPPIHLNGFNLSNVPVLWNDPANPNWLEQYNTIINAALINTQRVGSPANSAQILGVKTDEYTLQIPAGTIPAVPFSTVVNGKYEF